MTSHDREDDRDRAPAEGGESADSWEAVEAREQDAETTEQEADVTQPESAGIDAEGSSDGGADDSQPAPPSSNGNGLAPAEVAMRYEREVREETRETLRLIDMRDVTRSEKLALEADVLADAHEVEFFEQGWRKRSKESLAEIRRRVDNLASRDEIPERISGSGVAERVFSATTPAQSAVTLRPLSKTERDSIARHVGGEIVRAQVIYRTTRGQVVEVEYRDTEERTKTTLLSVLGREVRDISRIREEIDHVTRNLKASRPIERDPGARTITPRTPPREPVSPAPPEAERGTDEKISGAADESQSEAGAHVDDASAPKRDDENGGKRKGRFFNRK